MDQKKENSNYSYLDLKSERLESPPRTRKQGKTNKQTNKKLIKPPSAAAQDQDLNQKLNSISDRIALTSSSNSRIQ